MAPDARPDLRIDDHEGYLEAHLLGRFSAHDFKEQVAAVVAACKASGTTRVLLNVTALEGGLSTMDRFEMGSQGAQLGRDLKVAGLLRPDMIDPGRFGVVVARNRGMVAEVFSDRKLALGWLLGDESPPDPVPLKR